MERSIDELLADLAEIDKLLETNPSGEGLREISRLTELVADALANSEVAGTAVGLKAKAHNLAGPKPAKNMNVGQLKDAVFRLKAGLQTLKRKT